MGIADGGMAGGSTFFCIMRKFYKLPHDTKTLRGDAQGLPQRSEGTQTQRKLSLESDAFAAQNENQMVESLPVHRISAGRK